jgi:PKD repeat protein
MKALCFTVIAVALAGCGGGGTRSADGLPNPFVGSFTGTWVDMSQPSVTNGTLTTTTTSDGSTSGPWAWASAGESGTVTGSVTSDGKFTGTLVFSGGGEPLTTYTLSGTVIMFTSREITGNLTVKDANAPAFTGNWAIDLMKQ